MKISAERYEEISQAIEKIEHELHFVKINFDIEDIEFLSKHAAKLKAFAMCLNYQCCCEEMDQEKADLDD